MHPILLLALLLCGSLQALSAAETGAALKRYLYLSTPDGAQPGGSGRGILVFDIDQGHRFVRRIDIPEFREIRGFCGNAATHSVFYSTTTRKVGRFDLESEKLVWDKTYEAGGDRACVTLDGKKLFVPTGWWWRGTNSGFLVLNAENGEVIDRIAVGPQAHNSIATLDGRYIFLGTETTLTQFDASTHKLIQQMSEVGEFGVFPFTVDSRNRNAYVCIRKHGGVDVIDMKSGQTLYRVTAGATPIPHRTHGAGLTPNERELWISDQEGQKLFIFDALTHPPREIGHVDLSQGGHGWITFSLDGRTAWCHTPDVIDVASRKIIATLRDEHGAPVCSSKFLEVHFRGGKVVAMGDQFGLGRAHVGAR